jgi:transcriptional regulator GlxA family with amidase domain
MFPKVNLQTDRLITDENGIYTNGGAYSFLNLMIYLVEKYYDRPDGDLLFQGVSD